MKITTGQMSQFQPAPLLIDIMARILGEFAAKTKCFLCTGFISFMFSASKLCSSNTYFQKETSVPIVIIAIEFLTYKGKSAPWWKYSPIRQPGPPLKLLDSVHIWEVFPITLFQKSFVLSKNTRRA